MKKELLKNKRKEKKKLIKKAEYDELQKELEVLKGLGGELK